MSTTSNEMGTWFLKDKEGKIFNLSGPWGKSKCQLKNPLNCRLPFLSHSPNYLIFLEIGWSSYCMGMGRVWGGNSNLGKPIFGEKRFWLLGQVNTKNACPFGHKTTFSIFPHHSPSRGLPSCNWGFMCVHPSRWESFSSFFACPEIRFGIVQ